MLHLLRLLILHWRLSFRIMAQYPLNLFVWMLFGFLYHAASVAILWAMLQRFPALVGWTFAEMFFLYSLWNLAHGLYSLTLGKVTALPRLIREGLFDRFLIRPVGPLFQLITLPEGITIDDLLVGIGLFAVAQAQAGFHWSTRTVLWLVAILAGAALIKGGLLLALSTLSFWAVRTDAARMLLETVELEFVRFPLTIFPRAAQWILTFVVPLAFVAFLPAQLLLEKDAGSALLRPQLGMLTPAVGLVTFAAAYLFWRLGLLMYQGTGS